MKVEFCSKEEKIRGQYFLDTDVPQTSFQSRELLKGQSVSVLAKHNLIPLSLHLLVNKFLYEVAEKHLEFFLSAWTRAVCGISRFYVSHGTLSLLILHKLPWLSCFTSFIPFSPCTYDLMQLQRALYGVVYHIKVSFLFSCFYILFPLTSGISSSSINDQITVVR